MTNRKLYALTDEEVYILVHSLMLAKERSSITSDIKDMTRVALIPLDRDAAVERMTWGLSEHWRDMHTNEALGQQRMLARAALGALLDESSE